MRTLTDCQMMDLDLLARAIAASLEMSPRAWLSRFGAISCIAQLPKEHKHLIADYVETRDAFIAEVYG